MCNEKEICEQLPYTEITDINVLFEGLKTFEQSVVAQSEPPMDKFIFDDYNNFNEKFIRHIFCSTTELQRRLGFTTTAEVVTFRNEIKNILINWAEIICIDVDESFRGLQLGQSYQFDSLGVDGLREGRIPIVNSLGNRVKYGASYFKIVIPKIILTEDLKSKIFKLFFRDDIRMILCCLCEENCYWSKLKVKDKEYGICIDCLRKYRIGTCNDCEQVSILKEQRLSYSGGLCYKCYIETRNSPERLCEVCNKGFYVNIDIIEVEYKVCPSCLSEKEGKTENILRKLSKENALFNKYHYKWFVNYLKESKNVKSLKDRTFGLEFEVNSKSENFYESLQLFIKDISRTKVHGFRLSDYLIAKRDGSLGYNGIEFNTVILSGKEGFEVLHKIVEVFNRNFSVDDRCGLHVHIGTEDYNTEDYQNSYYFYQRFQEHFKYYVSKDRLHNNYCQSLTIRKKSDIKSRDSDFLTKDRYRSVNYKAISEFRTLEFRILEGTLNIEKIVNWIELHIKILNYIKNNPKMMDKNTSIYRLLKKILGKDMFEDFMNRKKYWDYLESDGKCVRYNW